MWELCRLLTYICDIETASPYTRLRDIKVGEVIIANYQGSRMAEVILVTDSMRSLGGPMKGAKYVVRSDDNYYSLSKIEDAVIVGYIYQEPKVDWAKDGF